MSDRKIDLVSKRVVIATEEQLREAEKIVTDCWDDEKMIDTIINYISSPYHDTKKMYDERN